MEDHPSREMRLRCGAAASANRETDPVALAPGISIALDGGMQVESPIVTELDLKHGSKTWNTEARGPIKLSRREEWGRGRR